VVYIIHAATDAKIAALIKSELERLLPERKVFVASRPGDIPTGAEWLTEIQTNLRQAKVFVILLTPRSVARPWVWYEAGVAWHSDQRRLPVVVGELDLGNIPYPLGASQALQLSDPEHAAQFFRDLGCQLEDPVVFTVLLEEAAKESLSADDASAWTGIGLDGVFYEWHGPLQRLQDRDAVLPPRGLLDALRNAGLTPTWGSAEKLSHYFEKGRMQVFQTDRRAWKRPVWQSSNGKSVLLVHVEDEAKAALRALDEEIKYNLSVAERPSSDQLGTPFSLNALNRVLPITDHIGGELHIAVLRARGAMEKANSNMEAALGFPKGSGRWAAVINTASQAVKSSEALLLDLQRLIAPQL
jgi:hypothetical protein